MCCVWFAARADSNVLQWRELRWIDDLRQPTTLEFWAFSVVSAHGRNYQALIFQRSARFVSVVSSMLLLQSASVHCQLNMVSPGSWWFLSRTLKHSGLSPSPFHKVCRASDGHSAYPSSLVNMGAQNPLFDNSPRRIRKVSCRTWITRIPPGLHLSIEAPQKSTNNCLPSYCLKESSLESINI